METKPLSLTIVMPARNEEDNLRYAVEDARNVFGKSGIDWEIILVNDGSTDRTSYIVNGLVKDEPRIKSIHHRRPMGIGCCFKDGVKVSTKEAITWFPGDGENDPDELIKYLNLLEQVDIIVPFVVNTNLRSYFRRFLSKIYLWIVNISFGTMFNYTNGNVIYRSRVFETFKPKSNGFFFQSECLIGAVRSGFIYSEVPVILHQRKNGRSKALTLKSFMGVIIDYIRFFAEVHILHRIGKVHKR